MQLENDLILRVARGEKTERTPVWIMRQAGRYLPEYRTIRNNLGGFEELIKNPELAAEVTIQPVEYLNVDAAIIFSDILVIPEAMGLPYEMIEQRGPVFPTVIDNRNSIRKLKIADPESDLAYVLEAIRLTKKSLAGKVPLIGFAGAPWTIMAYMVEGQGSKTFGRARKMLFTEPALAHELLDLITESTIGYLKAQINAGADLIQLFDSWAGILGPETYREFSLPYLQKICDAITDVPVTVFAKGAFFALNELNEMTSQVIGLDWNMNISDIREKFPNRVLQGNLDPATLYASFDDLETAIKKMLDEFGPYHHIANLGHGIYPDIDPEKARFFVNTVKEYSLLLRE